MLYYVSVYSYEEVDKYYIHKYDASTCLYLREGLQSQVVHPWISCVFLCMLTWSFTVTSITSMKSMCESVYAYVKIYTHKYNNNSYHVCVCILTCRFTFTSITAMYTMCVSVYTLMNVFSHKYYMCVPIYTYVYVYSHKYYSHEYHGCIPVDNPHYI